MPGTSAVDELEVVLDDIGGGGGRPPNRSGGGEGGGGGKGPSWGGSPARKYSTAILFAMVSITMFFMAIVAAFLVLRSTSDLWVRLQVPKILWANTAALLASSLTMEGAKKRLSAGAENAFRKMWWITTALGLLFLGGQVIAWRELAGEGVYASSTMASGFFYVFTAAHGAHLFVGICALAYVAVRKFDSRKVSRAAVAEVVSYYWHFMDGLWVFLFALLYFGR